MDKQVYFWFRRDLRLHDNTGLWHALRSGLPVQPVFIFDTDILDRLEDRRDGRVTFIHRVLSGLKAELNRLGSDLHIYHGKPAVIWEQIMGSGKVHAVYLNRDYEPYANLRDQQVMKIVTGKGGGFFSFKDQCLLEYDEVVKEDGTPYRVLTPYAARWKEKLQPWPGPLPIGDHLHRLSKAPSVPMPSLESLGFCASGIQYPPAELPAGLLECYAALRDYPAKQGTSGLGVHYRFGTVSIREMFARAQALSEKYCNELIWRDFYMMILAWFPWVTERAFKPGYDNIPWLNKEQDFARWCAGETGYPLVDAGMRELNRTGYMHNRVRMVTASFLSRLLLVDWRWGEAYFAQKLLDFELASNNGGWQWAAGCGADAAPYFRVFNPDLQAKRFDPQAEYIRKWVPEYGTPCYPRPMIPFAQARKRCLEVYASALKS